MPIPPVLCAHNLAEGKTVQSQTVGLGNAQIVLSTHAEATSQIPDITKVLSVPDLLRLYMQPVLVALAEKTESDLLGLCASYTANAVVGCAGSAIAESTVDAAETGLFDREDRWRRRPVRSALPEREPDRVHPEHHAHTGQRVRRSKPEARDEFVAPHRPRSVSPGGPEARPSGPASRFDTVARRSAARRRRLGRPRCQGLP